MNRQVLALVAGALSVLVVTPAATGPQPVRDLTATAPSSAALVEALTPSEPPPLRLRGGGEPKCEFFFAQRTRGGESPVAAAAAVRVLFALNSAALTAEARQSLDQLAEALRSTALAPCCFEIQGHTDSSGTEQLNLDLSQRRARAVIDYLGEHHGINSSRLRAEGFGESQPLADNESEAGRQKNRRVQVVNLGYGEVSG